ncbi:MAG: hypothetical protein Q8K58_11390 [Acidimicrobiales bacterium]|nr:hypothetical protein [Acidimicrobiales bacterium]
MIPLASLPQLLVDHLPAHLARQRWSGAHGRAIRSIDLRWHEVVRDDAAAGLVWALVDVAFADDADTQAYQVFIGVRPVDDTSFLPRDDRRRLTVVPGDRGPVAMYDALADPELAIDVLHLVDPGAEVSTHHPLVLEHSNTSIVYDSKKILKVFRRVEPGPNPDVEIPRKLAEQGFEHQLPPLAELRRDDTDLAVLRRFLSGSIEGWELAASSVRDLLDAGCAPDEAGGDFGPEARRLGAVLAGLHLAIADAWGTRPGDPARWAAEMDGQLRQLADSGADLGDHRLDVASVAERYRELAELDDVGVDQRIHGDLHLAQVLLADEGWYVLDFEGEPARRREERATTSSPLRDVAGMLRSFHYAAATGLAQWTIGDPDPALDPALAEAAQAWDEHCRQAFLDGYFGVDGIDALLPVEPEHRQAVLAAFELDKAVYEVGYELGYRPDQVWIPLQRIDRLTHAGAAR